MYLKLWTVLSASVYISNAKLGDFNPFIPARPGESPACAKKGNSYCEYIEDYPVHVINYLLERGVFDTNTLFKSEQDIKPPGGFSIYTLLCDAQSSRFPFLF
ncbi:uncharacterized protein LOC111698410 [Eurytemora carolleeae]|uniref:uncharacterized protein LOC111698410 n=1 Tax=Eurytemora carolleeae TaxID=1294199 RepID=UPI000C75D9C1|nr:uncharacterized protein LOC111698410 [Eurytemora carolleeae]|eukprot:XP_023324511.1 uncharacterized protein LOC111698410 [Eurytemora affinis]